MFAGESRDARPAGTPAKSEVSDTVTFGAKPRYLYEASGGVARLELTNRRASFALSLPLSVSDGISRADVVMITASPTSRAVTQVAVLHKGPTGELSEPEIVWDSATGGSMQIEDLVYWKKRGAAQTEDSHPENPQK